MRNSVLMYMCLMLVVNECNNQVFMIVFFFKQKTAYEMRISDWSSDVCSSDLRDAGNDGPAIFQRSRRDAFHGARGADVAQAHGLRRRLQIGRASCRERVCQYV